MHGHTIQAPDRPTFFMKRSDQLIARLKHLLYGMRFAQQVDGQVIFAWTPLPTWFQQFDTRDYHVNYIFDIRRHYAEGGARRLIFFDSVTPFPSDLLSLQGPEFESMRPDQFSRGYFLEQKPVVYSGIYYGYQFSDERKSQAQLDAEMRQIYRSLPLDPVVERVLATARMKIQTDRYAVLHVRKGDVGEMLKRDIELLAADKLESQQLRLTLGHYVARTAPFECYYPEIKKCIDENTKLLFTSDSPETLTHFTAKFGARHFIDINKFIRARRPIQKAFLDFNMMIGATKIISTGSTYAAFAATLGNCSIVNVAGLSSVKQRLGFLIDEYAPVLASDGKALELLERELEVIMAARFRSQPANDGHETVSQEEKPTR